MRRVGMARAAVWIALAGAGVAGLTDCTDFGGDVGTLPGDSDAATAAMFEASAGFPGALWDVTVPPQGGDGGADSGSDASSDGPGNSSVDSGGPPPPGGNNGSNADAGLEASGDDGGDAEGGDAGAGDAGADTGASDARALETGALETGAPETGAPDAGVDASGRDAGEAGLGGDSGLADADAGSPESGADAGAADSASPDSSGDSGTDSGAGHGCDPTKDPLATTQTCLAAQDNAPHTLPPTSLTLCSTCAASNGCFDPAINGGSCEMVQGNANLFTGTLPDGKTCSTVVGTAPVTETTVCMQTLSLIFSSTCAATSQTTPCLCGSTDPSQCQAGAVTPNGPVYDEYACDFNATSGGTIFPEFQAQTFGAGMANSIVQCAGAFSCDCF